MKQITSILALSALVLAALFAARTFLIPSSEFSINFPEDRPTSPVSTVSESPAAPAFTAAAGLSLITITWQPVADAATYELWWRFEDTAWQQLDDGSLTATTFIHTEFASGNTYHYTGRAVSSSGQKSPWAQQVEATVTNILDAPELTAVAGSGQITITWQPVTVADSYELWTWQNDATGWQRLDDGLLTAATFTHTGLSVDSTHHYAARALTTDGASGPWSQYVNATVTATIAAPELTPIAGVGQISLSWQAVEDAASYELWMRQDGAAWQQVEDSSPTDTSFTHTGLTAGETYYYTSRAVSASGHKSPWSPQVEATVNDNLAAPVLTATPGAQQITLTWQPVLGAATYELWAWKEGEDWLRLDDGSLSDTSFVHAGLTAGDTYFYAVRALSAADEESPWSEHANATAAAALAAPVLTAAAAANQVTLTWQSVNNAAGYELHVWTSDTDWQRLDDGSLTDTSFNHTSLTAGKTYFYQMRALTANREGGPWSEQVEATP